MSDPKTDHEAAKYWLTRIVIAIVIGITINTIFTMAIKPVWTVWQQGLMGQAALKKAEQEKLILIEQAKAEVEAATHRAKAIEIVGAAAAKYPEYRLQEFMGAFADALQSDKIDKMIFVPTEAQIPILEAGRSIR